MLIALSAAREDPSAFDWFKFDGKRAAQIAPNVDRKLQPNEVYGVRSISRSADYYFVFPDKISKKVRIDARRHFALTSKSRPAKFKEATATNSRAGIGGRRAQEIPFDHPRWRPKTQPSSRSEKTNGIDCKDYQWRVYKKPTPFRSKTTRTRDELELYQNDIIGLRFLKPATGGIMITPEGVRRSLPTELFDKVVQETSLMPKNRWITRTIDPEMVKASNVTERDRALNEQRQIKQQMREAKAARERKAKEQRRKEAERKQEAARIITDMNERKSDIEAAAKKARAAEIDRSRVDVGDYIRTSILGNIMDEEILDSLDMDDLESIEIDLDDMADLNVAVKDTGKQFSFEDDPSDDILSGLDEMLEAARQEDEDEISGDLESGEVEADDAEEHAADIAESEEEDEPEDEDEEDSGDEETGDEEADADAEEDEDPDEDFSEFEETGDEETGDEETGDEDDEDFSEFADEEETDEEETGGEEDDDELNEIASALEEADVDDSEDGSAEEEDEEDFDDESAEEDDLEPADDEEEFEDFEDEEFEDEDATLDGDDDEDLEEDEDVDDMSEDSEDEDSDQGDPDEVLDDDGESDVDDSDVANAEDELNSMDSFDGGDGLEDDDEEEVSLPEEADIISFNDDEENRKFLVFDVADMKSNDKVKMLKLYDTDNEPDEVHVVRVQTDRLKQFMDSIEVVSRMNAKTFGNYVTMVEEYPKSKEKLV